MKKATIWIIAACIMMIAGLCLCAVAIGSYNQNFSSLESSQFETNAYSFTQGFSNISVQTDTAEVIFVPSSNGFTQVVCYEEPNLKHTVLIENDTLCIRTVSKKNWLDYIGIHFDTPKITISIPEGHHGSLSILTRTGSISIPKDFHFENITINGNTGHVSIGASVTDTLSVQISTADIHVENISAGNLSLKTSTGKIHVSEANCQGDIGIHVSTGKAELFDVTCQNFITTGNTGSLTMHGVFASQQFSIERSTGNVIFKDCDASNIVIETDTGRVSGNFLTPKVFITKTDTGNVTVPESKTGGRCEITTDTGNIHIK